MLIALFSRISLHRILFAWQRPARLAVLMLCCGILLLPPAAAEMPALMLAQIWDPARDPSGWWISEKYDGVRGYWDGQRMRSRQGRPIHIPPALRDALPAFALDGELWAGRGRFEDTVSAVRSLQPGPGWEAIRYMVFDAPDLPGPFEQRMAGVAAWLQQHPSPRVRAVQQVRCFGHAHLQAFLRMVERRGGEGVMLRAAGSPYRGGRSPHLRKYKSFDDAEAVVVGYRPGRGRNAGLTGALLVALPDGTRFAIGSGLTDADRRQPPPIGSLVTFRHHGWTRRGRPRFPVYWRQRREEGAPDALPRASAAPENR